MISTATGARDPREQPLGHRCPQASRQHDCTPVLAPNGTRFGGWLLNTADNYFGTVVDFDGDGRDEIVVTSPWGIGILKLSGNTLQTRCWRPTAPVSLAGCSTPQVITAGRRATLPTTAATTSSSPALRVSQS